ncbi:MAG: hypothetical protein NZT61_07405 [Deltaproteobacteria bacterium]|nr:hypothetical protein [Deltaproteobacteria bacterium]
MDLVAPSLKINSYRFAHRRFSLIDGKKKAGGGSEVVTGKDSIFILIESKEGEFGIGEASFVTVPGRVEPNIEKELNDLSKIELNQLIRHEFNSPCLSPRVRYALSIAYLDLVAKTQKQPLWKLINDLINQDGLTVEPCESLRVKAVIFEDERHRLQELSRIYNVFKIKISPETFDEALELISSYPTLGFCFDGNYSFQDYEGHVLELEKACLRLGVKIEYLEQPLKPRSLSGEAKNKMLKLSSSLTHLRLGLDQDIRTLEDCEYWSDATSLVWVIKVSAFGSIMEVVKAVKLAKQAGIDFAIGGMFETVIGKTLLCHVAKATNPLFTSEISLPNRYFEESWLANDVNFLIPKSGTIFLPDNPGLGISPSPEFLRVFGV